jgi:phage terminase Nu1 subunit (DNA packaging protein)
MLFAASKFEKPNTENQTVDLRRMRTKSAVFFYPQNQKRRSIPMTKSKTLDQLRAEKERAETQLAQEQHKLERLENRKKYLERGERTKRTHRLCNLGGTIESLAPEVKDLTRTEMTELMEYIFSLAEVQRAVRHMAITHISQANREKELKADGTISSERHAD